MFDMEMPPIIHPDHPEAMYFSCCVDQINGETSIAKLDTETLQCYEIYQSRFRIIHMAVQHTDISAS